MVRTLELTRAVNVSMRAQLQRPNKAPLPRTENLNAVTRTDIGGACKSHTITRRTPSCFTFLCGYEALLSNAFHTVNAVIALKFSPACTRTLADNRAVTAPQGGPAQVQRPVPHHCPLLAANQLENRAVQVCAVTRRPCILRRQPRGIG